MHFLLFVLVLFCAQFFCFLILDQQSRNSPNPSAAVPTNDKGDRKHALATRFNLVCLLYMLTMVSPLDLAMKKIGKYTAAPESRLAYHVAANLGDSTREWRTRSEMNCLRHQPSEL